MPSTAKTLYFLSSALATAISVIVLGFSMSQEWAKTTMECARQDGFFNGSAVITLELFNGVLQKDFCPNFGNPITKFQVIQNLAEVGTTQVVLHIIVLVFVVLSLLFSAVSILISLYNSVSNPYETYLGPIGIYVCNSISTILSFLTLILFVANVMATNMAEGLVENYSNGNPFQLRNVTSWMLLGYYLVIAYAVLNLTAIAVIYIYANATYKRKKEQHRPTEDAPKEIMMY